MTTGEEKQQRARIHTHTHTSKYIHTHIYALAHTHTRARADENYKKTEALWCSRICAFNPCTSDTLVSGDYLFHYGETMATCLKKYPARSPCAHAPE